MRWATYKGAFVMLGSDDGSCASSAAKKGNFQGDEGLRRLDAACGASHRRQGCNPKRVQI